MAASESYGYSLMCTCPILYISYILLRRKAHLCSHCEDAPADSMFLPCHHDYACYDCGKVCKKCPQCKAPVQKVVSVIYLPFA